MSVVRELVPRPQGPTTLAMERPLGDSDQNPSGLSFRALLLEDFRTHGSDLGAAGFWAVAVHRLGNRRMRVMNRTLRAPLTLAYRIAYHGVIALFGIDLPYNNKIGRRIRISHHGCVRLNSPSVGDDVHFRHAATVGLETRNARVTPTIGNRVEIGPGACIVGGVHIGDGAFIGPNTVVADDVPEGATVLGVPARIVDLAKHVERREG